ncbi:MAG: radical SAM protein [Candidatus Zixiibacteriota bacterium]|nr:MAG: radical SAM protein [candidate division Zixibacteria bacterium]
MNILLLRPNSGIPVAPPPIGLMYLAGYLRKVRPGRDQITVLDGRSELPAETDVVDVIRRTRPDLVGVTAFSMEGDFARRYAALAKEHAPGCVTVIGGPYGTSDYQSALDDPSVDFCARGEGELTFARLVDRLESGREGGALEGLAFRRNGAVAPGTFPELVEDLNTIPYPAWDLIDLEQYFVDGRIRRLTNPIQSRRRGISLFSTRGCPYRCTYCHNVFGKKLRKRSVENVLGEIRWLVEKFGIEEIEFIDDVFNLDRPRAKAICDGIIQAGWDLRLSFPNGLRADQMDEELVDKMRRAGAYRVNYAVESGSPRVQKMIRKNLDLERARQIIDYTAGKGISTGGFFMLGFREETEEEAWKTVNYALNTRLHTASFFILTPFPNTPMYDEALQLGYDMEAMYSDYGQVSANLSKMPKERLEQLRKIAFRRFYFNPRRIWSIFRTTPRKWVLFKNFLRTLRMALTGKEF